MREPARCGGKGPFGCVRSTRRERAG